MEPHIKFCDLRNRLLKKAHLITITQNFLLVMATVSYPLNIVLEEYFLSTRIPFQWQEFRFSEINETWNKWAQRL